MWIDPFGTSMTAYSYYHYLNPDNNDSVQKIAKETAKETAGTVVMVPFVVKAQLDCIGGGICEFLSDPKSSVEAILKSVGKFSDKVIERNVQIYINVKESNSPVKTFVSEEIRWGKDLYGPIIIRGVESYCDKVERAEGEDFWEGCKARAEMTVVVTELFYAAKGAITAGKNVLTNSVDEVVDDIVVRKPKAPTEAYNRRKHYGHTPKQSQRKAAEVGPDEVLDHDPPLVKRYYDGDPSINEIPGYLMSEAERKATANDMCRMKVQSLTDSNKQGGQMSNYSKQKKIEYGL
jgi:hypothetical protein